MSLSKKLSTHDNIEYLGTSTTLDFLGFIRGCIYTVININHIIGYVDLQSAPTIISLMELDAYFVPYNKSIPQTRPLVQLLTDTLAIGEMLISNRQVGPKTLLQFYGLDLTTNLYNFTESTTSIKYCFTKDWVNNWLVRASSPPPVQPVGLLALPSPYSNNPFLGIDWGTPFKTNVETKRVHKNCRACGNEGSHNVVNHKEYYYCKSCRDEC